MPKVFLCLSKKLHENWASVGQLYIESFNGSFRDECLNINWFMSLEAARDKIERWRTDCNEFRPHSARTYLTPAEFARKTGSEAV